MQIIGGGRRRRLLKTAEHFLRNGLKCSGDCGKIAKIPIFTKKNNAIISYL